MVEAYQEMVDKIPAESRWAICAHTLTGAVMGLDAIIQALVGPGNRKEALVSFFSAIGPLIKPAIENLGLPTHDLPATANSLAAVIAVNCGPEMQMEVLEASPNKVVSRTTGCPFPARFKETGIILDCLPVCSAYYESMWKALKPNVVTFAGDKSLGRGDPYCGDRVVELST